MHGKATLKNLSSSIPSRFMLVCALAALTACVSQEPDAPTTVSRVDLGDRPILIQDVAVFDSEHLRVIPNQDVLVQGSTIVSVEPSRSLPLPADVHVVPGEGATLVPGLIDMHGHISTTTGPSWEFAMPNPEDNLRSYVYAGVTTVFDPGDSSDEAFSRRERVAAGELLGPRIYTAGKIITDPEGHPRAMVDQLAPWWIGWFLKPAVATGVASPEEAIAAVDERVDAGADAIKVVVDSIPLNATIMSVPVLRALVDQSHARGVRAVAHIGTTVDAIVTGESGIDLWIHGVYKESISEESIQRLVDFDIPMVSTSEVFDRYGRALDGPIEATRLEAEMISPSKLASFYPPPADFDPAALRSWIELMQETDQTRLGNVTRLHKAGVTILAGSDTQSGVFPGTGLHRELVTLVAAGLTPAEAIRAATLSSARYLADGGEPDAGIIAPGKRADLLLVNGDPTQNIAALSDIKEVIVNGRLLERQGL
ncbi:MAG: imidazolonepropionase-like amidohydrolase [Halioglobus sp.]|jgi:imidazolonepropionase-like amidohydrolase